MRRAEAFARYLVFALCLGLIAIPVSIALSRRPHVLHARMSESGGWTPQVVQATVGQPLTLHLTSDDVVHSFAVGQMDMDPVDIEPGKVTDVTLTFDRPGTYTFYCTRWCGLNHWRMRGTIEVSGPHPGDEPVPSQPLYVSLGIDLDAPHPAPSVPAEVPSAARGAGIAEAVPQDLVRFIGRDYYRAHSPAQAFAELKATSLTDSQQWDLVAHIWRSNTTAEGLEQGRRIFAQNCAACHGEAGGGNGVFADDLARAGSASLQDMAAAGGMSMQTPADFTDAARMLGASPALLQGKVLRGGMGTGMPMWGAIFTDEQTWNIIAYLYSLQFDYHP